MCRNIKRLFNFDSPATATEIESASLQFVRKISGYKTPSKINEEAFELAVKQVSEASRKLISTLQICAAGGNLQGVPLKAGRRHKFEPQAVDAPPRFVVVVISQRLIRPLAEICKVSASRRITPQTRTPSKNREIEARYASNKLARHVKE